MRDALKHLEQLLTIGSDAHFEFKIFAHLTPPVIECLYAKETLSDTSITCLNG